MRHLALLAALLIAAVSTARANSFVGIEYTAEQKRATGQSGMSAATMMGHKGDDQTEYSVKVGLSQHAPGNGELSESLEVQIKRPIFADIGYTPYAAAGLGEKLTAAERFSYYFLDAGVKVPLVLATTIDVGSHSVNAFDSTRKYYSTRLHAALSWTVGTQDVVGVRYSKSYGATAQEKEAWRVSYSHQY